MWGGLSSKRVSAFVYRICGMYGRLISTYMYCVRISVKYRTHQWRRRSSGVAEVLWDHKVNRAPLSCLRILLRGRSWLRPAVPAQIIGYFEASWLRLKGIDKSVWLLAKGTKFLKKFIWTTTLLHVKVLKVAAAVMKQPSLNQMIYSKLRRLQAYYYVIRSNKFPQLL